MMNQNMHSKRKDRLSRLTKAIGGVALAAMAVGGLLSPLSPAEAGDIAGAMDFKTCTELALGQSPYFTSSAIEIGIRQIDVSDSWWSFVPTVTLKTKYAFFRPKGVTKAQKERLKDRRDYSISFASGTWNPIKSFFSLKAKELVKEIAILAHLQVIDKGVHKLAEKLLELDMLNRLAVGQDKVVALNRQHLTYVQKLHSTGAATLLQVQTAAQRLAVVQAEVEKLSATKSALLEGLKFSLGLKPIQRLDLNLKETRHQILGPFDPKNATLEQARSHSFLLKIQKQKEELQDWQIILAYAKYFPTINFGWRTSDLAQENVEGQQDFFAFVGADLPLWDGFSRYRNISRQKEKMRQSVNQTKVKDADFRRTWRAAQKELQEAEINMNLARISEKLARLEERQSEIRYKSDNLSLPKLLESRNKHLKAQTSTLSKTQEYEAAVLKIRHLSGDLFQTYVNVEPWKE
ncbi:MAG: TolC family protein [Deltaproteobacteria bacterium]|nr:TolC family protein [Deltaproteobacteria bacterium]